MHAAKTTPPMGSIEVGIELGKTLAGHAIAIARLDARCTELEIAVQDLEDRVTILETSDIAPPEPEPGPEPEPEGDPQPGPDDEISIDFRAGGNKDLQQCNSIGDVQCLKTGAVDLTTDFDGKGTHALVFPWRRYNGQAECSGNTTGPTGSEQDMSVGPQPLLTGGGEIFLQWKIWMGRTPTGGGTGEIGAYRNAASVPNAPGGHKYFVLFRDPNSNQARMTFEQGQTLGKWITTMYDGYAGPPEIGDGSIGQLHFFGESSLAEPFNPDDHIGEVVTFTCRFKAESAKNAHDGEMTLWINGVLRDHAENMYTGIFGTSEWQLGGPTWICPSQDQTHYMWDMVVWRKKAA
jgi:hypothetical protein